VVHTACRLWWRIDQSWQHRAILVGSGLAVLSALITFFFIRPLSHDGLVEEDGLFRQYLEAHGYDTSGMGFVDEGDDWSQNEKEADIKVADA
jgi:hypothetical protein